MWWDEESHRSHRACLCVARRQAPGGRLPAGRQVRQILDHLSLPTTAPTFRTPPDPPDAPAADQPRELVLMNRSLSCLCPAPCLRVTHNQAKRGREATSPSPIP